VCDLILSLKGQGDFEKERMNKEIHLTRIYSIIIYYDDVVMSWFINDLGMYIVILKLSLKKRDYKELDLTSVLPHSTPRYEDASYDFGI